MKRRGECPTWDFLRANSHWPTLRAWIVRALVLPLANCDIPLFRLIVVARTATRVGWVSGVGPIVDETRGGVMTGGASKGETGKESAV